MIINIKDKSVMDRIRAYQWLTGPAALITNAGGDTWNIETPEKDLHFENFADLVADIDANLECMRELMESGQIEPEMWEGAWK